MYKRIDYAPGMQCTTLPTNRTTRHIDSHSRCCRSMGRSLQETHGLQHLRRWPCPCFEHRPDLSSADSCRTTVVLRPEMRGYLLGEANEGQSGSRLGRRFDDREIGPHRLFDGAIVRNLA